ncbi:hypothetical protein MVEN_02023400 [Mycena venus]|uniref:Uncharacterized protein n=1 Tax=Mycena venus TaxID=2733690 RepID=A0A8H6XB29_9AGAR|nr:hypothetical protein MVEN_02023400 [Mycena venus]
MFFSTSFVSAVLVVLSTVNALRGLDDNLLMETPATERLVPPNATQAMLPQTTVQPMFALHAPLARIKTGGGDNLRPVARGNFRAIGFILYERPQRLVQSRPGKSFRCGKCCGWEARANGNVFPTNCTAPKLNAWPNSGDGCTSAQTSCVRAKTCAQDPVIGARPAATMNY